MYVVCAILFIKPWREYRLAGGFYSQVTSETLPEDVWLDWMGRMAKKGGDAIGEKVDQRIGDSHAQPSVGGAVSDN